MKVVGTKKPQAPQLDLKLPELEALPSDVSLTKPSAAPELERAGGATRDERYTLVSLTHAKSFAGTPQGLTPIAPLTRVTAAGRPLLTESFTSVVRVRSPARRSSSVELVVLDARDTPVMEARGELVFRASEEAEWAVDWAPTAVRTAGTFQVQVRVGGLVVASAPLLVVQSSP